MNMSKQKGLSVHGSLNDARGCVNGATRFFTSLKTNDMRLFPNFIITARNQVMVIVRAVYEAHVHKTYK